MRGRYYKPRSPALTAPRTTTALGRMTEGLDLRLRGMGLAEDETCGKILIAQKREQLHLALGDLSAQLGCEHPLRSIHAQTFTIGNQPNVQVAQIGDELQCFYISISSRSSISNCSDRLSSR